VKNKLTPLISFLLFLPLPLFSQTFSQTSTCTLSSTACVVTIQQPAAPLKNYRFKSFSITSTIALSVNVEKGANLATTTAGTPAVLDLPTGTAEALSFTASNASANTVVGTYQVGAGGGYSIDLSSIYFPGATAQSSGRQATTIRTSAATGTVSIVIVWQELSS
jgi:hypothetical protein